MGKYFGLLLMVIVILMAFRQDNVPFVIHQDNFVRGESLQYKATYGIFNIGEGSFKIQDKIYRINNRPCYKIDAFGSTSGFIGWIAHVDDHWYEYVDTTTLLTQTGYRDIIEGRYKKNEVTYFNFEDSVISVKNIDHDTGKFKEPTEYPVAEPTRAMLSGFLFLRSMNFDNLVKGDTVSVKSFLDDTFYDLQIIVYGRENLKTKAGTFKSIVFRPVMPENSVFDGEDSILAWFSDDENKIPLKVSAKMFIGHAGIELTSYTGLRNKPALIAEE